MARSAIPKPTDAELAILVALWRRGPSTVRDVHEELRDSESVRYTTTLKQMQLMHQKGLLARDASQRTHVYRPAVPEDRALRQLTGELLARVFGGSAEKLVMHALQAGRVSADELANIRRLLDEIEEAKRCGG